MGFVSLLAISIAVLVVYVLIKYRHGNAIGTTHRPDLFHRPGSRFLLGHIFNEDPDKTLETILRSRYHPDAKGRRIYLTLPGMRIIDISDPVLIEYVQKTNMQNYSKGSYFARIMYDVLGEGIFAVSGDKWLHQRKATSKISNTSNLRGIVTKTLQKDLEKLQAVLARHARNEDSFDMSSLFYRFTLDSFVTMCFGQDIGCFSVDNDDDIPFSIAFDFVQRDLMRRFDNPLWIISEWLFPPKEFQRCVKVIDDMAYGIIDARDRAMRAETEETEGAGGEHGEEKSPQDEEKNKEDLSNVKEGLRKEEGQGLESHSRETADDPPPYSAEKIPETLSFKDNDITGLYMSLKDDAGRPWGRKAVRDAVINLIIAGRDTTAQVLGWAFYHLCADPKLAEPLRKELAEKSLTAADISWDNHRQLDAFMAFFHEALRLHPSVPKNAWRAAKADVLPDGTRVDPGDILRWSDWEMARMPEIWGEDATTFNPERWRAGGKQNGDTETGTLGRFTRESPYKFHAFNAGPRLCLGQSLATYEAIAAIAGIVEAFDVEFAPGWEEETEWTGCEPRTPRFSASLTLPMKTPLRVSVKARGK